MSPTRLVPILCVPLAVVLLAGALWRGPVAGGVEQPAAAPRELAGLEYEVADAVATQRVDEALRAMRRPEREWLHAGVWVRSGLPELRYEAEGVYYRAPGGRFRLEVGVKRGDRATGRKLLSLCDGRDRWQATRAGESLRDVRRLGKGEDQNKYLRGPEALLASFDGTIAWVRSREAGDEVIVTGIWHAWAREKLAKDGAWPAALPRVCRLTLRGRERWPARLEWYGPTAEGGVDRLLVEMEFRDPHWGRPLSEEDCARLFTLDPGGAAVEELATR